jgi:ferric-dicitrate binding protein FerR (iron transport regulator)
MLKQERILREALDWHKRLHADDCSATERAAFRCWQQQHRFHARAFEWARQHSARTELAAEAFVFFRRPDPQRARRLAALVLFFLGTIVVATYALRVWLDLQPTNEASVQQSEVLPADARQHS